jgi:phospholipid N-methyltransferase
MFQQSFSCLQASRYLTQHNNKVIRQQTFSNNSPRGRHHAPVYDSIISEIPNIMNATTEYIEIFQDFLDSLCELRKMTPAINHQNISSS